MNGCYPLTVHIRMYATHSMVCGYTVLPPQHGRTALMEAALNGHSGTVRVLVQLGADLNVQDKVCM